MAVGLGASLLLAAVEIAFAVLSKFVTRAGELARFSASVVTLLAVAGAVLGAVEGALLCAVERWTLRFGERRRRIARALSYTSLLSALLTFFGASLAVSRWAGLGIAGRVGLVAALVILQPLLFTATYLGLPSLDARVRRSSSARGELASLVAAATATAAAYWTDRTVLVRLYPELHWGLAVGTWMAAQLCALSMGLVASRRASRCPSPRTRAVAAVIAVATLAVGTSYSVAVLERYPRVGYLELERTVVVSKVVRLVRAMADFDRDGYSPILGGGDCDDANDRVHPGSLDLPENGIDEDCSGADLTLSDLATTQPNDLGLAATTRGSFNVILITIDTLRADHVGTYGYHRRTTPNLDAFAEHALVFERAYAQANNTATSFPSLLTGRYPSSGGWDFHSPKQVASGWPYVERAEVTLPEYLARIGYSTTAIVHGDVVFSMGLDQGFDSIHRQPRHAADLTRDYLRAHRNHRFFLWRHIDFPHAPYEQHEQLEFGAKDIDRYDSEVAAADARAGELLALLKELQLEEQTAVIVAADHGEEFRDHGGRFHASTLYDEQIRVPLMVRIPGVGARRVRHPAELVDVLPTVLRLVGIAPPPELAGESLLTLLDDRIGRRSVAYSEMYDGDLQMRALIMGNWKLIFSARTNTRELYDLAADPSERDNLADRQRKVTATLSNELSHLASREELLLLARARRLGEAASLPLARALGRLTNESIVLDAIRFLVETITPKTSHLLVAAVLDRKTRSSTRKELVRALEVIDDPESHRALATLADDQDTEVAKLAAAALERLDVPRPSSSATVSAAERPDAGGLPAPAADAFVDVGIPASRPILAGGFGNPETIEARTVAWSLGPASLVIFDLEPAGGDYSLVLTARAIHLVPDSGVDVAVTVNDRAVGSVRVLKRWKAYNLEIPSGALRQGRNRVELSYSFTVVPAEVGDNSDRRELSVLYDSISLGPRSPRSVRIPIAMPPPAARLLSGWSRPEPMGSRTPVWSVGASSKLEVDLTPSTHGMRVSYEAASFPPIAPNRVRVLVNGVDAGELLLSSGWSSGVLTVKPGTFIAGKNVIELSYERTGRPRDFVTGSKDDRELAVRWDSISIAP